MVGINDQSVKHPLFPSWREWAEEVKPAMRNLIILGSNEDDPRTIYIRPKAKRKDGPELSHGEQLLQSYKRSRPSAFVLQKRFTTLRKLEDLLNRKTDAWDGGPRYIIGLHGSVILNLDDDESVVDVCLMDRKYNDGRIPSHADEPRALRNLVSVHDMLDGNREFETMSLYGSTLRMLDHETNIQLNISLNALHLMFTTLLLRQYALMSPVLFLPLCHFAHRLLRAHRRSLPRADDGERAPALVSSYAANLLVLFYLQLNPPAGKPFHVLHAPDAVRQARDGSWALPLRVAHELTREWWVGQVGFCWPMPFGWSLADRITRLDEDKEDRREREQRRRQKLEVRVQREFEATRKRKIDEVEQNGRRSAKVPRLSEQPSARRCYDDYDSDGSGSEWEDIEGLVPRAVVSRGRTRGPDGDDDDDSDSDESDYDSDVEEIVVRRGFTFTDDDRRLPMPPPPPPPPQNPDKEDNTVEGLVPTHAEDQAMQDVGPPPAQAPALHAPSPSPAPIPSHLKGKARAVTSPDLPPDSPPPPAADAPAPPTSSRAGRLWSSALSTKAPSPELPETVEDLVNPAQALGDELVGLLFFLESLDPRSQLIRVQLGHESTRAEWERDRLLGMQKARPGTAGAPADEVVIEDATQKGWNVTPKLPASALAAFSAGCGAIVEEMADDETTSLLGAMLERAFPPAPPPANLQLPPSSSRPPPFSTAPASPRPPSRAPLPPRPPPPQAQAARQYTPLHPPRDRAPPPESSAVFRPPSASLPGRPLPPLQPPPQRRAPEPQPQPQQQQPVRRTPSVRPQDPRVQPIRPTAADLFPRAPPTSAAMAATASAGAGAAGRPPPQAPTPPPDADDRSQGSPTPPPQVKPRRVWKAIGVRGAPVPAQQQQQ